MLFSRDLLVDSKVDQDSMDQILITLKYISPFELCSYSYGKYNVQQVMHIASGVALPSLLAVVDVKRALKFEVTFCLLTTL